MFIHTIIFNEKKIQNKANTQLTKTNNNFYKKEICELDIYNICFFFVLGQVDNYFIRDKPF